MLGTSFFHCRSNICTASLTADIAQHMESLAWRVRLAVGENQVWLALREVEEHLSKVAVRPREPWAGVLPVIDGDGLANEPKTTSVLHDPQSVSETKSHKAECARLQSCRESSGSRSRYRCRRWPKCGTSARGAKHQRAGHCEKRKSFCQY